MNSDKVKNKSYDNYEASVTSVDKGYYKSSHKFLPLAMSQAERERLNQNKAECA
jgi:hypothetical protein